MHFFSYVSNLDKTLVDVQVRERLKGFNPLYRHASGLTGWYLENMYGDACWFARPEYLAFLQAGGTEPKLAILMANTADLLRWDADSWETINPEPDEGFIRIFCVNLFGQEDGLQSEQGAEEALQALKNYHSCMLHKGYHLITPGVPH